MERPGIFVVESIVLYGVIVSGFFDAFMNVIGNKRRVKTNI